jgi:hypothetical protein
LLSLWHVLYFMLFPVLEKEQETEDFLCFVFRISGCAAAARNRGKRRSDRA